MSSKSSAEIHRRFIEICSELIKLQGDVYDYSIENDYGGSVQGYGLYSVRIKLDLVRDILSRLATDFSINS